jgi:UDP-N-acetylglucosamine 2-epimerase (non-hydrolysing)
MMEKVIVAKSRTTQKTKICCTRYGNVMCSRGSVIPLWIDQIRSGNPITITDGSMTRFIMSLEEAVDLVLFAFEHGEPGDILVQKAPACTIQTQAEAVCELFGADKNAIKVIGIRPEIRPDAVLVLGDTNSCLSVIGAKRLHIPIFHMEAGNRCEDECLPEETNRRIVDIISDVNMAYSEHARRYLADCGLPKERTYVTGSPMAEKYDMPILYSCHPRSRKRIEATGFQLDKRVIQHEPLGFHDYNCLQMNAFAVVSDSGTLPEESSFFTSVGHPFPAVCIRTSTERPEALDKACFILAGIDGSSLLQAVDVAVEMNRNRDLGIPVPDYVDENVSDKVVKIIQSYTGVVNKMVWRKF